MNKQMTLSALNDELAQAKTKKKEFLSEIERVVPWKEWLALIKPHYYKGERGNKPYPLELMLRLYLLQNLYDLSDMATAEQAIDSRAFSEFCGVDSSNQVPDGDTIGRFRKILTESGLQTELFMQVVELLTSRGLILRKGTIVDSTIIAAPPSTKTGRGNETRKRIRRRKATRGILDTRRTSAWTGTAVWYIMWRLRPQMSTMLR
jgi:IS5 family transposase